MISLGLCPFDKEPCKGTMCQLWVTATRPPRRVTGEWVYEGCGLVNVVPWKFVKKEEAEKDEA